MLPSSVLLPREKLVAFAPEKNIPMALLVMVEFETRIVTMLALAMAERPVLLFVAAQFSMLISTVIPAVFDCAKKPMPLPLPAARLSRTVTLEVSAASRPMLLLRSKRQLSMAALMLLPLPGLARTMPSNTL